MFTKVIGLGLVGVASLLLAGCSAKTSTSVTVDDDVAPAVVEVEAVAPTVVEEPVVEAVVVEEVAVEEVPVQEAVAPEVVN